MKEYNTSFFLMAAKEGRKCVRDEMATGRSAILEEADAEEGRQLFYYFR